MRRVLALAVLAATALGPAPAVAAEPGAGVVVRAEALPRALWVPGTGAAQRVTYWSRTSEGKAAQSTGAVFVPAGTPPAGGWPVLSWAHGTVGLGDACAPSTAGRSERDRTYLGTWLRQGYAVVATDYIGLGTPGVHAYLDGQAEANAVIDMVRAARATTPALARRWAAIGQSQGGGAALFTAAKATRYAPELDYRGAVTTGPASNVTEFTALIGPYVPDIGLANLTAYLSYVLRGVKAARPGFDLDSYLTPLGRQVMADAERLCYADMAARVKGIGIGQLLSRPLLTGDYLKTAREVLDVPLTGYDRPLFIGQGTNDTDVPIFLTAKLTFDLSLRGQKFTYKTYPGKDHSATMAASLTDTIPFVRTLLG
ncbi:lipase family protein [Actinomadura flavalba]|uniref:lipase family protein n=1 Tax=Actinomadura flavalba TaxID=1120938 RepID=UPI000367639F|nr:lipase family protein [Actinomadura flavalba]